MLDRVIDEALQVQERLLLSLITSKDDMLGQIKGIVCIMEPQIPKMKTEAVKMKTETPFAQTLSTSSLSETVLSFINSITKTHYETTPQRFRDLVSIDNPHLTLLATLTQLPSKEVASLTLSMK